MIATIRKALLAGAFTLAAATGTAMLDGDLTQAEVLVAVGTALVATYTTYQVPNRDA